MAKYPRLDQEATRKPAPATTPEGSENQMASLAMQLAEKRLRNQQEGVSCRERIFKTLWYSRNALGRSTAIF